MSRHPLILRQVRAYLEYRRALGYELRCAGLLLLQFAKFVQQVGWRGPLTTALILGWVNLPKAVSANTKATRLSVARGFARYLAARDGRTEVPDHSLTPRTSRSRPHLFSDEELAQLLEAAWRLKPNYRLRPLNYRTLFGLLAATGLRVGEALKLTLGQVDLNRGILRIEQTKFKKSRLVPLHPTATRALRSFAAARNRVWGQDESKPFFVGPSGSALSYWGALDAFHTLCNHLGWQRGNGDWPRPRIHDLRHTFASRCLLRWYRNGENVHHRIAALSTYLGHACVTNTYWYLTATPELLAIAASHFEKFATRRGREALMKAHAMPRIALGPTLQSYFYSYLVGQRDVSPRTITSYRDTFRLFLRFLQKQGIQTDKLCVDDLNADRVLAFLADLEKSRDNCARSRNARFAAIRSFLRHATAANPLLLPVTQRVLAIPMKRFDRVSVGHLTRDQMQAVLDSPNTTTLSGQRDQLLLLLMYNTGARVSEIAGLKVKDVGLEPYASVHITGKGRKHRTVPLWRKTTRLLRAWLKQAVTAPECPLLPNSWGEPMSRSGVAQRFKIAVTRAAVKCPALRSTRVSPHTVRHTTAMHLLQSGVDLSTIAMWLGHESIETTHQYLAADVESKRQALSSLPPPRILRNQAIHAKSPMTFLEEL